MNSRDIEFTSLLFHSGILEAQKLYSDPERAARIANAMPHPYELSGEQIEFLESLPFFFLATADGKGNTQCNYKGGGAGIIYVEDSHTLYYPEFAGNDMMLSVGNIIVHPYVGILAMTFDPPRRLKINGRAELVEPGDYGGPSHEGDVRLYVRVKLNQVIRNCNKRISIDGI